MSRIQDEKWVNSLPEDAVKVAEEINLEIAKVIAERIKKIGELSPSDVHRLTNSIEYLGADFSKITKLIAKYSKKGQTEIVDMLKSVADECDSFANIFYSAKGIAAHSWRNDAYLHGLLEAMARQTAAEFTNLSQTLAYKIDENTLPLRQMYTRAIDKAIYQVQSGTVDYHTAMRKTVKQLSGNMRVVKWDSGYSRRLDSHIRQNLIDGVKQLQQEMLNYHGEQYGSDGVEISAHAISAPDHAPVQGRQFSNEEFYNMQNGMDCVDVKGNHFKGFPRPITQWNCRHIRFPIIIGISKPVYTDEQLKDFAENSEKKYKLTQQQRAMETKLRQLKMDRLTASAAGDELEAKRIQRKINEQQTIYRRFSEKHNLPYDTKRASVEGYRRISVKNIPKSLDNNSKNGIINLYNGKGISVAQNDWISNETYKRVVNATKRITSDFKVLENHSETLRFGKVMGSPAKNEYNPLTGKNQITLDKNNFANPVSLLQSLKNDYKSGMSYDTDFIESLVAHEMGHNAHIALALKYANIPYGKPLTLIEQEILREKYNSISQEIYLICFNNETFCQIQERCVRELGKAVYLNPRELIAQSFGNYYYGKSKSSISEKVVNYFMKGLK